MRQIGQVGRVYTTESELFEWISVDSCTRGEQTVHAMGRGTHGSSHVHMGRKLASDPRRRAWSYSMTTLLRSSAGGG